MQKIYIYVINSIFTIVRHTSWPQSSGKCFLFCRRFLPKYSFAI